MIIEGSMNPANPDQDHHSFDYSNLDYSNLDYKGSDRLDVLRNCINDENYLHAAIQRLALIMSNELMEITRTGSSKNRRFGKH